MIDLERAISALPPCANPSLIKQRASERRFLEVLRSGRLPHAWLIHGPYGIGKATFAFRCARFLLAKLDPNSADDLFIEPSHSVFRQIAAGGHPDLVTITTSCSASSQETREIKVEAVRQVEKFLHHTPASGGRWRIVIIDGLDQMSHSGHNAILKILEEPPAFTLFLLVATTVSVLPSTVLSRCCRLGMPALSATAVNELLEHYHPDQSVDSRTRLVELADGSIGRALDIAQVDGELLYQQMLRLLDGLPRLAWAEVHTFAGRLESELQFTIARLLLQGWLERSIKMTIAGDIFPRLPEFAEESKLAQRLLPSARPVVWLAVWEEISNLFRQAEQSALEGRQVLLSAFHHLEKAALTSDAIASNTRTAVL